MTQQDVLNLLEKEKKWMSIKEIADRLKIGNNAASQNLHRLYHSNFVDFKLIKTKGVNKSYYKIK